MTSPSDPTPPRALPAIPTGSSFLPSLPAFEALMPEMLPEPGRPSSSTNASVSTSTDTRPPPPLSTTSNALPASTAPTTTGSPSSSAAVPPALTPAFRHPASLLSPLKSPTSPTTMFPPPSPSTPTTPTTPKKATNPLIDLNETEKCYVDQLTGVIRKVAGAWSRSNLPPPHLDAMFRCIESIYKANRSLYNKLKEVGTNPSSPKALGDLLMRWVDDLDGPYTHYCANFRSGFDTWHPVSSNPKLPAILEAFSQSLPPPPPSATGIWTLDELFRLPAQRLRYYKKLYGRLLKGTQPGKNDHKLLVGALDKLEKLMAMWEERESIRAGDEPAAGVMGGEDEVVLDMRAIANGVPKKSEEAPLPPSNEDSAGSSSSNGERSSRDTAHTSVQSRSSLDTMSMPVSHLEKRLLTDRTIDLFTMKPKVVKLQITPPQLTYTREMRFSTDAVIRFTPRATGVEIVHRQAHIFLLSDLFLVCERMTPSERRDVAADADMWLCYPPLAGKVLRVAEVPERDDVFSVAIMRKETFFIQVESVHARNYMLKEFKDCIEFASSVGPVSKQAPPPMPALPSGLGGPPGGGGPSPSQSQVPPAVRPPRSSTPDHIRQQQQQQQQQWSSSSPSSSRPPSSSASPANSRSPSLSQAPGSFNLNGMRNVVSPPPPLRHDMPLPPPGAAAPARSTSAGPMRQPSASGSIGPGQIIRAPSAASVGPGQVMRNPSIGPGQVMHPMQGGPPPPGTQFRGPPPPSGPPGPHGAFPGSQQPPPLNRMPIHKSPSMHSLRDGGGPQQQPPSQMHPSYSAPPVPAMPHGYGGPPGNRPNPGFGGPGGPPIPPQQQSQPLHAPQPRTLLPSAQFSVRGVSVAGPSFDEPSPPNSPVEETPPEFTGPVTSTISAQMKCKVFLKQHHASWKSLGAAKLKLYRESPTNIKQLVVEADSSKTSVLISTIVLTDGVERVGKTGVAIELSDKGQRTGIVYMIQLRNESSAGGLYDSLLAGSDRA